MNTLGVGQQEWLESLYRAEGAKLWRALLAYSGDPEVAKDAASEAFAQILRRGEGIESPKAWLWRTAFKVANGELKRRSRTEDAAALGESYVVPEPAREVLWAVLSLPAKQRASILLYHFGGYPVREVAEIIGSTEPAVRVHLSRGRKRLRAALGEASDE